MKENTIVTNPESFNETTIEYLLKKTIEKNIINNDEYKLLKDFYLKDKRSIEEKVNEIQKLNREKALIILNKNKTSVKKELKISLESISEFTKLGSNKKYISIHYPFPDDKIKVIENISDKSAKEIFESLKDSSGLVNLDGFVSSFDIYEKKLEPEKIEVKIMDITELSIESNFNKLTTDQKEVVYGTIVTIINNITGIDEEQRKRLLDTPIEEIIKMLNKKVYLSPEENIVIISIPNEMTKDEIKTLAKDQDGNYKLVGLNAIGFDYLNNDDEFYENNEKEKENDDDNYLNKTNSYIKKMKPKKPNNNKLIETV